MIFDRARLDRVIDRALAEMRLAGAVVMANRAGEVIYSQAKGYADIGAAEPLHADSLFRLASLTKPVASVAVLALAEAGRLDIEADIREYLPEFRPKTIGGQMPTITVRHLLSHTSGLTYDFLQLPTGSYWKAGISSGLDQPGVTMTEHLERINGVPLVVEPGKEFNYSISTDILGAAMEAVCGESLGEVLDRLVFRPLKMHDTGFLPADPARLATAYFNDGPLLTPMAAAQLVSQDSGVTSFAPDRWRDAKSFQSAGAGLIGSAADYLVFLSAIAGGDTPILNRNSLELLSENAIGQLEADPFNPGWGFSLGFSVLRDRDSVRSPQSNGTWSWGGAYGHSWFVDPAENLVVVALTNTAMEGVAGNFPLEVRDAFY